MATIYDFSSRTPDEQLAFQTTGYILDFADALTEPAALRLEEASVGGGGATDLRVSALSGPDAGKSVVLLDFNLKALNASKFTFASLGKLVIGDNSSALNDDAGSLLSGTLYADVLMGLGGNDTMNGNSGNDEFWMYLGGDGTYGTDTVNGGAGSDTVRCFAGAAFGATANLGAGTMSAGDNGGTSSAVLTSIENFVGTNLGDTIVGSGGANRLEGLDGNDSINGGAGTDTLAGGAGSDTLNGGTLIDTVDYGAAAGPVTVDLAAGTASDGSGGIDSLVGVERVSGSGYGDVIKGNGAANVLDGNGGDDSLVGSGGADVLRGGAGADTMSGGAGDDTYYFSAGDVLAADPSGTNDVVYSDANVTLPGGMETLFLLGSAVSGEGNSSNNLIAAVLFSSTGNVLHGRSGDDEMHGGGGDDDLWGGPGNDTLIGGPDSDDMWGESGNDLLWGSAFDPDAGDNPPGVDVFHFTSLSNGHDTIMAFDATPGVGDPTSDLIDLTVLFNGLGYTGTTPRADGWMQVQTVAGGDGDGALPDALILIDANGGGDNYVPFLSVADVAGDVLGDGYFIFQAT